MLKVIALLFAGGLATSFAEYHFSYNLYDSIKDAIVKLRSFISVFHVSKKP